MGLDSVELLIEVEKTFKINIPGKEAEKIITVGDFYDIVWRHLSDRQTNLCKTQTFFYKTRNYFTSNFNTSKKEFSLNAHINELVPVKNRRIVYEQISAGLNMKLPALVLPDVLSKLLNYFGYITIAGSAIIILSGMFFFDITAWYLLITIVAIFLTSIISKALDSKRVVIPQKTARDFIESVFGMNYTEMEKNNIINRNEVELIMKQIIIDKTGVDEDEIIPAARICDDLGID